MIKTLSLKSAATLKSGTVIPAGTVCKVSIGTNPETGKKFLNVENSVESFKTKFSSIARFKGVSIPSVQTLERWSNQGFCKTPFGEKVEPDGIGASGFPSWMLLLGYI